MSVTALTNSSASLKVTKHFDSDGFGLLRGVVGHVRDNAGAGGPHLCWCHCKRTGFVDDFDVRGRQGMYRYKNRRCLITSRGIFALTYSSTLMLFFTFEV
jgi:hypothetical protein